jgi:hypothetical protein
VTYDTAQGPVDQTLANFFESFYDLPPQLALAPGNTRFANGMGANTFLTNNVLPQKQVGGQPVFSLVSPPMGPVAPAQQAAEGHLAGALEFMLKSGFIPVAATNDKAILGPPTTADLDLFKNAWFNDAVEVDGTPLGFTTSAALLTEINACHKTLGRTHIGWRGDSRDYRGICQAGGLLCKAESEFFSTPRHMRRDWHPFADVAPRRFRYYRKSQKDNCLYTVVSTSFLNDEDDYDTLFRTNVTFPQLEELPAPLRQRLTNVSFVTPTNQLRHVRTFVDEVNVYLCEFRAGMPYFDTGEFQRRFSKDAGFPEVAVRGIPADRICAHIRYIRVHLGTTNGHGFVAIPVVDQSQLLHRPSQPVGTKKAYDKAFVKFAAAWGPHGAVGAAPVDANWQNVGTLSFRKVGNMDVHEKKQTIERYVWPYRPE